MNERGICKMRFPLVACGLRLNRQNKRARHVLALNCQRVVVTAQANSGFHQPRNPRLAIYGLAGDDATIMTIKSGPGTMSRIHSELCGYSCGDRRAIREVSRYSKYLKSAPYYWLRRSGHIITIIKTVWQQKWQL